MYIKNTECDITKMEETTIIMKKDDNSLHVLNETASLIWEHIEDSVVDDIVKMIISKYIDVPPVNVVLEEVNKIIDSLVEKGLLALY